MPDPHRYEAMAWCVHCGSEFSLRAGLGPSPRRKERRSSLRGAVNNICPMCAQPMRDPEGGTLGGNLWVNLLYVYFKGEVQ